MRPPVLRSMVVAVIGWKDPSAASPFPWWGARPRVSVTIWVVRLGQAVQKHYHGGDVLIGPNELWGSVPPAHGVVLDQTGVTPKAARRSTCTGRNMVR